MELIKTIEKERNSFPLLKAIYSNDLLPKFCIKEKGKITEYYLGLWLSGRCKNSRCPYQKIKGKDRRNTGRTKVYSY